MKKLYLLSIVFTSLLFFNAVSQPIANDVNCTSCIKSEPKGEGASTLGIFTKAYGDYSFSGGKSSFSEGLYSFSFGLNDTATNEASIALGYRSAATGIASFATGYSSKAYGDYSTAMGVGAVSRGYRAVAIGFNANAVDVNSFAIGKNIYASNLNSFVIGTGSIHDSLENDIENSLKIGFGSTKHTFFIGTATATDKTGKVGIGDVSSPAAKLHIRADDNEDAAIMLQPTGSNYLGKILFGDEEHSISGRENNAMVFKSDMGNGFSFEGGNITLGAGNEIVADKISGSLSDKLQLYDNSGGITITNGGKVGIQNSNPLYQLTVNGDMLVSSDAHFFGPLLQLSGQFVETSQIKAPDANGLHLTDQNGNGIFVGDGGNILHDPNLFMATSQIKAPDATGLSLTDQNGNGIFVDDGGNVGIGTTPDIAYMLDVNGPVNFTGNLFQNGLPFETSFWQDDGNDIYFMQRVGIGLNNPNYKLDVAGTLRVHDQIRGSTSGATPKLIIFGSENENASKIEVYKGEQTNERDIKLITREGGTIQFFTNSIDRLKIRDDEIIIGRPETQHLVNLKVNGHILAHEVEVTPGNWWDEVFHKDYKLSSLADLETFIGEHGHLPEIPSETEVMENGIKMGEMQALLLKKIEELTLYIIDQDKKIEKLEGVVDKLKGE